MVIVDFKSNVVEACFHVHDVFEMEEAWNGCNSEDILDFVLSMVEESLDVHGMFRVEEMGHGSYYVHGNCRCEYSHDIPLH